MTPSEAAVLVLQAGAIGKGGEVFVLDMGAPVAVIDLAKEMIRLAGLEPDKDIQIVFTQPSPGEKLFEDILTAEEGTLTTKHHRIYVARTNGVKMGEQMNEALGRLQQLIMHDDIQAALKILCDMVPNFCPANGLLLTEDSDVLRSPVSEEQPADNQWYEIQGRLDLYEAEREWEKKPV